LNCFEKVPSGRVVMHAGDLPQDGVESRAPGISQAAHGGEHPLDRMTFSHQSLNFLTDPLADRANNGDTHAHHCLVL
jgi:hypothetical protein